MANTPNTQPSETELTPETKIGCGRGGLVRTFSRADGSKEVRLVVEHHSRASCGENAIRFYANGGFKFLDDVESKVRIKEGPSSIAVTDYVKGIAHFFCNDCSNILNDEREKLIDSEDRWAFYR